MEVEMVKCRLSLPTQARRELSFLKNIFFKYDFRDSLTVLFSENEHENECVIEILCEICSLQTIIKKYIIFFVLTHVVNTRKVCASLFTFGLIIYF